MHASVSQRQLQFVIPGQIVIFVAGTIIASTFLKIDFGKLFQCCHRPAVKRMIAIKDAMIPIHCLKEIRSFRINRARITVPPG